MACVRSYLIQDIGSVRAGKHDNALRRGKAVHLHQQLIQRVLPLVIAASKAAAPTRPPNSVNLVCTSHSKNPTVHRMPLLGGYIMVVTTRHQTTKRYTAPCSVD